MTVKVPPTYPMKAPVINFPPGAIWHPSVDPTSGDICMDKDFGPTKQLKDLAVKLLQLLSTPPTESPTNQDAAQQMDNNAAAFLSEASKRIASQPNK